MAGVGVTGADRTSAWRPLLGGSEAAAAWSAIHAIADDLSGLVRDRAALAGSALGADLALFFHYLAAATGDDRQRALGDTALDAAADALSEGAMPKALFDGFLRIAWSVEHLRHRGWIDAQDDTCEAIDDAVLSALERGERQHFDLMSGLAGQAVYALERAPLGSAPQILARIGEALIASATAVRGGHAWRTDAQSLAPWQRAVHPDGFLDVGLSHGTPCAIRVLSELWVRGLVGAEAAALVERAVAWLLTCECSEPAPSGFPYFVGGATASAPARLAWCYGDPGVALALLQTARLHGCPAWAAEAHRLAHRSAHVDTLRAGVSDAALCHGAAGLAHTFRRLAVATGDATYDGAARTWWSAALAMRDPAVSGSGFRAYDVRKQQRVRDATLLTGDAGIGLALLAAVSAIEPMWDRLLLCSTAPAFAGEVTA